MDNKFLAKWYINYLDSKHSGSTIDRISMTLFNSKIKLTPHQIDAALFAFKSPISKGVLLADEVGLGKTIEAGIIIAQLRLEKKANILIIAPASLIRQWNSELYDKFSLESQIMDRKMFNSYTKKGYSNPFDVYKGITICSYQFASSNSELIRNSNFEMVILDEAHKLRNYYTEKSIIANNIKYATENFKKVLLTATPIQNSIMDLYGLTSFIDDNIFGDKTIFRYNYVKNFDLEKDELRDRLKNYMHRTLRSQVTQYIKYTKRIAETFYFTQNQEEQELYMMLQDIIINPDKHPYIIPGKHKHLLLLIMSKLMGSSVYALKGTLDIVLKRLNELKSGNEIDITEYLKSQELLDEVEDDELINSDSDNDNSPETIDPELLAQEIEYVKTMISKADSIKKESKYDALLNSLNYSFAHLKEIGANEKVLIFTESRRTQDFLYEALKNDGYEGVLLYNGSNSDDESKRIYNEWISRPENAEKSTNNKDLNMRSAILDEFKNNGTILISTEAGAEGLNLQFCSLVINYDLPWNPQRVEQRIGRCHRFGQKFDVTVINFINNSNKVEQRIYELLSQKFLLFDEVFGASDEVLGKINNVENLEYAIASIYQNCRTTEEIDDAFDKIQEQFGDEIKSSIDKTKKDIIDNFEEDIQKYFEDTIQTAEVKINYLESIFWNLTKIVLKDCAEFNDQEYILKVSNLDGYNGEYKLSSRNEDNKYIDYNFNTKLGNYVLDAARGISEEYGKVTFNVSDYQYNLKEVENLKNKSGLIKFCSYNIESFDDESYLFFSGRLDDGTYLSDDVIQKMFRVKTQEQYCKLNNNLDSQVDDDIKTYSNKIFNESSEKNNEYLNNEIIKINNWAEDKIQAIELEVEQMREQRKELRKQSDLSTNSTDKLRIEKEISSLTERISKKWLELSENEEAVESKRNTMVESIKKESMKTSELKVLFTIEFEVI